LAIVTAAPPAREQPVEYPAVQGMPELWQRRVVVTIGDDAVERQDQRHGGGLLQVNTPRDLNSKVPASFRAPVKPVPDKRFDIVGVEQRLEVANPMAIIFFVNYELMVPCIGTASENDPPGELVSMVERLATAVNFIESVDYKQGWRVPVCEECAKGFADPGAAKIADLGERTRHNCLADVYALGGVVGP
jgi:hypothetical protein